MLMFSFSWGGFFLLFQIGFPFPIIIFCLSSNLIYIRHKYFRNPFFRVGERRRRPFFYFSRHAAGLSNRLWVWHPDPGPIPLSRVTLTIYRMALHFGVTILFAGRKNGEKSEDRKVERQCEKGGFF